MIKFVLLAVLAAPEVSGPTPIWERYPKLHCEFVRDQMCYADLMRCSVQAASSQANTGYLNFNFKAAAFTAQGFTQGIAVSEAPYVGSILSRVWKSTGQDNHAFIFLENGASISFAEGPASDGFPITAIRQLAAYASPTTSVWRCRAAQT